MNDVGIRIPLFVEEKARGVFDRHFPSEQLFHSVELVGVIARDRNVGETLRANVLFVRSENRIAYRTNARKKHIEQGVIDIFKSHHRSRENQACT